MDQALAETFNASRSFADKSVRSLCYAPHTSLYFDTQGRVRVCCHNSTYVLGDARTETLDEMWRGKRLQILRDDLERMRFGPGCGFCARQTEDGWLANAAMRRFDTLPVPQPNPDWPQQMEFSISNSCNLECVMCAGNWSSAIRARREKLPPMTMAYSDEFIDSLQPFLPHLKRAKFLGGEPFLIREYYRIWDMMVVQGLAVPCHVTTNGTQYNAKIEKVIDALPFSFSVSLDGATKQTVERIRVNAVYEEQIENLRRFRDYTRERKTSLSLTYCFMRINWHELGDYCLFADEWDCPVGVNSVVNPPEFGVYNLPVEELHKILEAMERQDARIGHLLKRNRGVWQAELDRLRRRCGAVITAL